MLSSVLPVGHEILSLLEASPRLPYIQPLLHGLSFAMTAGTSASPMLLSHILVPVQRTAWFVTRIRYAFTTGSLTSLGVGFEILKDGKSYSIQPGNGSLLRDMAGVGGRPFNLPYPIYVQPGGVLQIKCTNVENVTGTAYIILEGVSIFLDFAHEDVRRMIGEFREDTARFGVLGVALSIAGNTRTSLFIGCTQHNNFEKDFIVTRWTGMSRDTILGANSRVYLQFSRRSNDKAMNIVLQDSENVLATGEYAWENFPFVIPKGDGLTVNINNTTANNQALIVQLQGILYDK